MSVVLFGYTKELSRCIALIIFNFSSFQLGL